VPFVYSIATFASMRGYEQFRNGPMLHKFPVRVVGIGGGFAYGHAGPTHHAVEDLAILRTQPGVAVIAPADGAQARTILFATRDLSGPAYLRIDKADWPDIPELNGRFQFDAPELLRPGDDLLFLTTGTITHEVLKAADELELRKVFPAVAVMAHLGYEAREPLVQLLRQYRVVLTVEEGSEVGGLGSLAAEAIAGHGLGCRLTIAGVRHPSIAEGGGPEYLRRKHGLDSRSLAELARSSLQSVERRSASRPRRRRRKVV
jgi:transketolase